MSTPAATLDRPTPPLDLLPTHAHTSGCFWDARECRWQCLGPEARPRR
jgi:hypothetical protein